MKKNNKHKSPNKFQNNATKDANLVLKRKKKEEIKKKEQIPIISQNIKKNNILKEITYPRIEKKKNKKIDKNQ